MMGWEQGTTGSGEGPELHVPPETSAETCRMTLSERCNRYLMLSSCFHRSQTGSCTEAASLALFSRQRKALNTRPLEMRK